MSSQSKQNYLLQDTESEVFQVLMIGLAMVSIGLVLIITTNVIMNREKNRIMNYLEGKVEELHQDENSRYKSNLRNAHFLKESQEA